MPDFVKLADLHPRRIRKRHPVLVGRIGPCRLVIIDRHDALPGSPTATLFAMVEDQPPQHDYSTTWLPLPPTGIDGRVDVRAWVASIIEAAAVKSGTAARHPPPEPAEEQRP
jgi:hypothetical protein